MTDIFESFLNSSDTDAELYPIFITLCTSTTDCSVQALDANPYA